MTDAERMRQQEKKIAELLELLAAKDSELKKFDQKAQELQEKLAASEKQNLEKDQKIDTLTQAVLHLRKKLFGRKSEVSEFPGQISMFSEQKSEAAQAALEQALEMQQKELEVRDKKPGTAKRSGITKDKYKGIPVEVVDVELDENSKCSKCGADLKEIGQKVVRSEVEFTPARLKVIQYVEHTYVCTGCGNTSGISAGDELSGNVPRKTFYQAKAPKPLLNHCFLSPSLAAYIFYQKYALGLPLKRQESFWHNLGLIISRKDMCYWVNRICEEWLEPLTERFHEIQLAESKVLHADETRIQCNHEPGRKASSDSFMWVLVSGDREMHPVVYFRYTMTRNQEHAKELVEGWNGSLVTDGYAGYHAVLHVTHGLCWCHLRRYYIESIPLNSSGKEIPGSKGAEAVKLIDKIFHAESFLKELSPQERLVKRQTQVKPLVEDFWKWVDETSGKATANEELRKALTYSLNQKEKLNTFLEDGKIPIHNQKAENAIRPFATHRRAWLFADTQAGAKANAISYSLVETAKANQLNVYEYLKYCFSRLPDMDFRNHKELLDELLPWSESLPKECRMKEDAPSIEEIQKQL